MKVTRSSESTLRGPGELFTGEVFLDHVATPEPPGRVSAGIVRFSPGARTAWHRHPFGQTIYVTEGVGRCQSEGGAVMSLYPGDRVFFEPGENHWHGAAPDRFMTHLALLEVDDDGSPGDTVRLVTEEEYNGTGGRPPLV